MAKNEIAKKMHDPDAAKFSDMLIHRGETGIANKVTNQSQKVKYQYFSVCGSVNGKNLFGAYTGKTRFVVSVVQVESEKKLSVVDSVHDEGTLKEATVTSSGTGNPESIFEAFYWNKVCVNEQYPKTYTGI
ncbi:hypothetical protein EXT57_15110 [Pectobacterium brasiliense]|nr:hypothetical protein [Pectobacterium brasiliense]